MKYAVLKVINGSFYVHAENFAEISLAKVNYHGLAQTLWNSADVKTAMIMITDENLNLVDGCKEFIFHE